MESDVCRNTLISRHKLQDVAAGLKCPYDAARVGPLQYCGETYVVHVHYELTLPGERHLGSIARNAAAGG